MKICLLGNPPNPLENKKIQFAEVRKLGKNIQISTKLFLEIVRYFYLDEHEEELYKSISKSIENKLDCMVKHELYTQYKTAISEEERDRARKKYLESVGMRESFRW